MHYVRKSSLLTTYCLIPFGVSRNVTYVKSEKVVKIKC